MCISGFFSCKVQGHIKTMQKLYDVLCNGYVSTGSQRRRIDGDTTQLPFADGLTEEERRIAQKVNYLASHMPGNPMTRRVMGQVQFGARIIYGDCVFMTVSLNEQHSALVLRMMRGRRADPMLGTKTMQENNAAKWLMVDVPNLEEMETAEVEIPVPAASVRAQLAAQNPHAVMSAFQLEVRVRLAQLLGLRMCFRCPDCRCRDRFGSNMLPCGGVFGAAVACGGAIEFQYHSSPHFHFEVFLANIYQYHTLNDIRKRIEAKLFDPQEVFKWYEWVKMEASPDLSEFSQDADHLREEWWDRFQNREHDRLCMLPRMLAGPSDGIVWGTNTLKAQLEGEESRKVVWMLHTANDVTFARLRLNLLPFLRVNYSRSVWLMGSVATPKASPCTCYLTAAGAILWQKRRSQHWERGAASKTSWSCKGFWIPMSMLIVLRCTQHRQVCDWPMRQAKEDFAITLP